MGLLHFVRNDGERYASLAFAITERLAMTNPLSLARVLERREEKYIHFEHGRGLDKQGRRDRIVCRQGIKPCLCAYAETKGGDADERMPEQGHSPVEAS